LDRHPGRCLHHGSVTKELIIKDRIVALIQEQFPKYNITKDFLDTLLVNKKSTGVVIGNISFKNVSVEKQREYMKKMAEKIIQELIKRNFLKR
jgi:deoxyribodipyrimidine photolyase